jgi:hypothetical protein
LAVAGLTRSTEILEPDPRVPQNGPQGPLRQSSVIRNGEASMGWGVVSENDVASSLSINLVTELLQHANQLAPAEDRKPGHETSTTTSSEPGGTGSPRARRLST